jgi:hypothetical protein
LPWQSACDRDKCAALTVSAKQPSAPRITAFARLNEKQNKTKPNQTKPNQPNPTKIHRPA